MQDYLQPPIGDYAVMGDCRSAALVSKEGSIDWLCWPRFDSPSLFAAVLDPAAGRFSVRPAAHEAVPARCYLPGTNVIETEWTTGSGRLIVRDLMPVASEEAKGEALFAQREVLRQVEAIEGAVELAVLYEPRPGYGRVRPKLEQRGAEGIWCRDGRHAVVLRSSFPLALAPSRDYASGQQVMQAGDVHHLSLSYSEDGPAVVPRLGGGAAERLRVSVAWWREWASACQYKGPYQEQVLRSALALKLLTFAPSGAVIAAPTTSLPEAIGGPRNWDYRYCWLRDASFTVRSLLALGYGTEAAAFLGWMLHATRLSWPELQVVYSVHGEANIPERELSLLRGYRGSRPVRAGNDAHSQLQLDVYGEVVDAASRFVRAGGRLDRASRKLLDGIGHTVVRRWREPDDGIWEVRSGRQHHVHSKVLCWVALDRLIEMEEAGHLDGCSDEFQGEREALRQVIEERGFNEGLGAYTRTLDGADLDASVLLLPLYGYCDAGSPRMRSTVRAVRGYLGEGPLLYRYRAGDGLPEGEGTFGICAFWLVECLARAGEMGEATGLFEQLLGYANDVGLYAEEIDPASGEALGNFPQGFTHIGLINAALTLAEAGSGAPAGASVAEGAEVRL
jgi:GH15 family glucan-1,4-alpha-glucosidase